MKVPSLEGGTGDWDTHKPTQIRGVIPNLAKACYESMAGLITDLKDRDLHATILWMCGFDHRQLKQNGVGFDGSFIVATEMLA